jgi:tRNA G18 (ribose-2'-O)-methylase SpoU
MLGSNADFSGFFTRIVASATRWREPVLVLAGAGTVDPVPLARPIIRIADPGDPRLADYAGLTDPARRRRIEAEQGFFIAESPLVVRALVESGRGMRSVLVTPAQHAVLAESLEGVDAPVYVADDDVLRQIVGFDLHRGAVASGVRWEPPPLDDLLDGARRVALVEKLNDYENLGVLFRNAAAFGIDAVLLDTETADPLYRRCVRVSIGHVLTVPWARIGTLEEVRSRGFTLFALTPAPDAVPLDAVNWPDRSAVMLGAEGPGLSRTWLDAADAHVRIPMRAGVDSLNVATAAAIAFYAST